MTEETPEVLFVNICTDIAKLDRTKYRELRVWLILRPHLEDWTEELMETIDLYTEEKQDEISRM